jgi:hypothetical protein
VSATRELVEPVDASGGWPVTRFTERERLDDRRLWAAVMLTADLAVCQSILSGRRVLVRQLNSAALKRALRGAPLPDRNSYVRISGAMLDSVAEGGSFAATDGRRS